MSPLQITINTLVTMFSQRKMCRTVCSIVLILKIPIFDIQVLYTFVKYEIIFVVRILKVFLKIKIVVLIVKVGYKTILLD